MNSPFPDRTVSSLQDLFFCVIHANLTDEIEKRYIFFSIFYDIISLKREKIIIVAVRYAFLHGRQSIKHLLFLPAMMHNYAAVIMIH